MDGGMVFMRCNADHHGVALVGAGERPDAGSGRSGLHHMAFEVATVDEVLKARAHLEAHGVEILFEGQAARRRPGRRRVPRPGRPLAGNLLGPRQGSCPKAPDGPDEEAAIRPPGEWREVFTLEDALDDAPPGQDTRLADPSLRRDSGLRRD